MVNHTSSRLVRVLDTAHSLPGEDGKHRLDVEGYGYHWFRVGAQDSGQPWTPMP